MRDFSQLLDALVYTRSRTAKLKLIGDYLRPTPDPDRGYALAALTGELNLPAVKPAAIRAIAEERVDPVLLYMSRDYVGDMAETVSLLWPAPEGQPADLDDGTLRLSAVVERLASLGRAEAPGALAAMLDHLDTSGRFALLKLAAPPVSSAPPCASPFTSNSPSSTPSRAKTSATSGKLPVMSSPARL